ncbi:glycoside hydrolase family 71 protein [Pleurotus eryngii]|uniref:Glycoside hydrolase family 71 protein n=1 Tax=Pleurotus eryngii TaxID=5323 RepID=A0A9P5ZW22_PLEER|nr:glycoside hydrolase family 71 protein [Pleurotus eryngii]
MCFIDHDEQPDEMDDAKGVFAHFMVGNTYPYVLRDWTEDIELAILHHLDGFVLNIGSEDWQKDRVADCFQATEAPGSSSFKLFFSFDMSVISCKTQGDIQHLLEYIQRWGNHPSLYRRNGKVVVSTFSGENSLFGFGDMETAWNFVKQSLEEIVPIYFMPSFFIDPARYDKLHFMDGAFNWNGGWPLHLSTGMPRQALESCKLDTDDHHLRCLGGRSFIAAISPWFFTHYGPDTWNKNWIYRGDDWLFVRRWEQLIAARDRIDVVQIISWNDYGESHYIGPIKGAQPNSQAWVDGFDHLPWLKLAGYFARAFKEGVYPPIEEDHIYLWARPHPKDAEATDDNVPRPRNWELTDDTYWVVVLAKAPAMLILSDGVERSRTIQVPAGVTKASHPLESGKGMEASLYRGGDMIAACKPSGFCFNPHPPVYNFNAFVVVATS